MMTARTSRYEAALDRFTDQRAAAVDVAADVAKIGAASVADLADGLADCADDVEFADWLGVSAEAVAVWFATVDGGTASALEEVLAARSA